MWQVAEVKQREVGVAGRGGEAGGGEEVVVGVAGGRCEAEGSGCGRRGK